MLLSCWFLRTYKTSGKITDGIRWLICFISDLQIIPATKSRPPISKATYYLVFFSFGQRILLIFCEREKKSFIIFVSFEISFIFRIFFCPVKRSITSNNLITFCFTKCNCICLIITKLVKFLYWKVVITCSVK